MMSFTRDTASAHKLEPKEKADEFWFLNKMFIQSMTQEPWKKKIRLLPVGVEAMTFHKATGDKWVLRPLN